MMTNAEVLRVIIIQNYCYINVWYNQVLLLEAVQANLIFRDFQLTLQNKGAWESFILGTLDM
jgi:hypothetical protein